MLLRRLVLPLIAFAWTGSALADDPADAVIRSALPKVVKLYGTGGFRGLEAYGTGMLVSDAGHVLTSWGTLLDAEPVVAVLGDGRRFQARIAGADPRLGIAVLRLEEATGSLPHFDLSKAAEAAPGDRVYALSNMFKVAAGDEPASVMHGSILAHAPFSGRRGRFDASLDVPVYFLDAVTNNPGADGGPVIDLEGRLVGMIGRELQGGATETWVNYAVPAEAFRDRVAAIVAGAPEERPATTEEPQTLRRPLDVGLVLVPDVTARTPAFVTRVLPGSPAIAAGLLPDDLIVFMNDAPIRSIGELGTALSKAEGGEPATLVVRRGGRLVTLRLAVPEPRQP